MLEQKLISSDNIFTISTDKTKIQIDVVVNYLHRSYWASETPEEQIVESIKNSLCFGLFRNEIQIGFARVITDYSRFAYLADVFILEEWRGKGLSKWLIKTIIEHPKLQTTKWMLATKDAHGLYEKFDFTLLSEPDIYMTRKPREIKNG
jgi:GNAT superfamily N-acetyltransferase